MLGDAGGGVRATHRQSRTDGVLPQPLQDRPDSESNGADGSFPEELRRTKPYGYSLFNLDAMAILAQTLTTKEDNLWTWQMPDGRGMAKAMAWMYPFIADKRKWAKPPDVMYDKEWPVRQPCLVFAGVALDQPEYLELWKKLKPDPTVEEVLRNFPSASRCCGCPNRVATGSLTVSGSDRSGRANPRSSSCC